MSKEIIRKAIHKLGLDIHKLRPYGTDPHRDIRTGMGGGKTGTVLDVGANEGQTALEFIQKLQPKALYCFEPSPETFQKLQTRLRGLPNVKCLCVALGDSNGEQPFYLTQSNCTNSLLPPSANAKELLGDWIVPVGKVMVQTKTLDTFFMEEKLSHVDLLKLDTQGFDLKVLSGGQRCLAENRISYILVEVNFVPLYDGQAYFHEVYHFLWERGLRLVGLYGGDYRQGHYLNWCDALFVHPAALEQRLRA